MPAETSSKIMGILNITPDSFSDGGSLMGEKAVTWQIREMLDAGVDILDVGGESTRPFAEAVSDQVEMARVIPVIERIRQMTDLPISIDTTKAVVAEKALASGATIVNDISALRHDPDMLRVVKGYDGPLIIMHMQGTPGTMQVEPHYDDIVAEITDFFRERIDWLTAGGIDKDRIVIDPGIGFGKTVEHNLIILNNISRFKEIGCPVLVGHSRKSFIGKLLDLEVDQRDCATAMLSFHCAMAGADIVRVHDVQLNRQALQLAAHMSGIPIY
jgi:dihydropteroate synthase